ncbi:MAG: hypothetical protein Q6363_006555 [Candidatus Njordarchaeota archaeon]
MTVSITISEEKLDKLIEKIIKKVKDEILREIFGDIIDILKEILKTLNELAEAQRRTEERLNELAEAQRRTEETLRGLIGEVARLRGEFIEYRVITALDRILSKYGLFVYPVPYEIREIDAIVEGDDFYAIIEICKRCDLDDVRQVVEGARKFEQMEGIKPDILIIFSYTGQVDKDVLEEAKKLGIIVENNIRRLSKFLISRIEKKKKE